MKRSRFTERQIAFALQQAEAGTPVLEVCRKMGITEQTFYRWNSFPTTTAHQEEFSRLVAAMDSD